MDGPESRGLAVPACLSQPNKAEKGKLLKVGKLRSAEAGEKGSLVQAQVSTHVSQVSLEIRGEKKKL